MHKVPFCIKMKTRDYKQFAPGEYYHLYNRGNGKMDIFREPADYHFLLSRLEEYLYPNRKSRRAPSAGSAERYQRKTFTDGAFSVVCYCLMPNHFHFLMRQNGDEPLSALMLNLWSGYSKYFNKKYNRVGSLFQDQFKAVAVDSDEYLKWLSAYIHQNPRVARLVRDAGEYPYSSYQEYLGRAGGELCDKEVVLGGFRNAGEYEKFVSDSLEPIYNRKELDSRLFID